MKTQRALYRLVLGGLAVAGLGVAAVPREASACGHFMADEQLKVGVRAGTPEHKVEHRPKKGPDDLRDLEAALRAAKAVPIPGQGALGQGELVANLASAEDLIAKNQLAFAAGMLQQLYPNLAAGTPRQGPSVSRALEMLAVVVVRTHGDASSAGLGSRTREQRLEWATATLHRVNEARGNDVRARAHLGEALVARGAVAAGKVLLEELAASDLLPNAEGFAALARLRAASGEGAAADDAKARCRAMSKSCSV